MLRTALIVSPGFRWRDHEWPGHRCHSGRLDGPAVSLSTLSPL